MEFNNIYVDKNSNLKKVLNDKIILNKKLFLENNIIKNNIDNISYNNWKIIRSICSDYEIVGNNKIHQNYKIKEIVTVSRAYFKLLEILNIYENMLEIKKSKEPILIDCLCEAPGGFIKCLYDYRNNENDVYKTISIKDNETNLINWNIKNIKNLEIIYGDKKKNHDGNIFNPEILNYYIKNHKEKVDIVTADGGMLLNGFEENYKSNYHIQLFLCELYIAMNILKNNGVFILKIYDLSPKVMIDFLIMINNIFYNVRIFKPKTSREMNNEKYIICKNLKKDFSSVKRHIWNTIKELWNNPNYILVNMLTNKTIKTYEVLVNLFKTIDYKNLITQNKKLKYAMDLKNKNIYELKNILKQMKSFHFRNAYKWFKLNNIEI